MRTPTRKPTAVPHGFLAPKPKRRTIAQMTIRELHDLQARNTHRLANPYVTYSVHRDDLHAIASRGTSSFTLVQELKIEQRVIRRRLADLCGVDGIQEAFQNAGIRDADDMRVDPKLPSCSIPETRMNQAKQKALAGFVRCLDPTREWRA
jgi:hypothetical protein